VKSLGTISVEEGYHGMGQIYPIGYAACHSSLPSLRRPGMTTAFTTTIRRGHSGPLFEITCSDDPDFKLTANNASKVWSQLKAKWLALEDGAKEAVDGHNDDDPAAKKKSAVSGPRKIGLSHPDIRRAIECLPDATKCRNYKFVFRSNLKEKEGWTPEKAFKRSLRVRSDKKKSDKKKSPKKDKKKKKKSPKKAAAAAAAAAAQSHSALSIHSIVPVANAVAAHPMSSGHCVPSGDPKQNVIVIEDSPSGSVSVGAVDQRPSIAFVARQSAASNEVIDLCGGSEPDAADYREPKKSRKRKHPSAEDGALGAPSNVVDDDLPTKKRKIEGPH